MRKAAGLVALLFIAGCNSESSTTENQLTEAAYQLPKEITLQVAAERGIGGEIYIIGSTNLPDGTKIGVSLPRPGGASQDYDVLVTGGEFRSAGFTDNGASLRPGDHKVQIISIFNGAWQSPAILQIVGEGGKNLNGSVIKLDDPSLIDSDKQLDVTSVVKFPVLSDDAKAVSIVKLATLTVEGERSSMNVGKSVDFFMNGFRGLRSGSGWSAINVGGNKYRVAYDFVNGDRGNEQALWEVDVSTKQVRYINQNAKNFSWVPAD